jgi:plasmid maintenance system antidote protein VapI
MKSSKSNQKEDFNVEIGSDHLESKPDDKASIRKDYFKSHIASRSEQRKIKNQILSMQYRIEAYLDRQDIGLDNCIPLENFLSGYLKILNLSLKHFAKSIDTTDANLKKYLSGDRKFNSELAMKFGHFFHTSPELWLMLHLKNELVHLKAVQEDQTKYSKYDYEKQLQFQ